MIRYDWPHLKNKIVLKIILISFNFEKKNIKNLVDWQILILSIETSMPVYFIFFYYSWTEINNSNQISIEEKKSFFNFMTW